MWDPGSLPGDWTCTCPLHWKLRVLTIGPPGKSQSLYLHMGPVGVCPWEQGPWCLIQPCLFWASHWLPGHTQDSIQDSASGLQREHRPQAGQAGVWREATGKRRDKKPEIEQKGTDQVLKLKCIWAEPLWMGVPTYLRASQGGLDPPSHSLSAALSRHPTAELCETSFINPAKAEIPWAQNGSCHGKLRTMSPNSSFSEFKVWLGRWDQGPCIPFLLWGRGSSDGRDLLNHTTWDLYVVVIGVIDSSGFQTWL